MDIILEHLESKKRPLLFAYSAFINENIIEKCKQKGFNYIIEAPLTVQKINTEILQNLGQNILPDIKSRIIGNKF
jgi:DNA repair photolyase